MARSRLWIFAAAFCLWTVGFLVGCGGSDQPPAPQAKQVVKGKIPPPAKKAEPVPVQVAAKPEPSVSIASAKAEASASPATPLASETDSTPSDITPQPVTDQIEPERKEDALLIAADLKRLLSLETEYAYEPEGKIDPFAPVFDTGEPEDLENKEGQEEPEKRIPQSPIEMVDLSQLTLTGVILAPSGNRALVQDATGKGYVIYMGTYIGNREGQVTKILSDRLIVTEKTRDDLGRPVTEEREIKLPKPPGEM